MPPKKRKFESTFPAARIKKIMQLDDDVGRVASSVPIVISRAVEMFLQALLTEASGYAASRNAKTLTVGHIKHCIEIEKQWDFLKDLTAKVPDISACNEAEGSPKRGRKRKNSSSKASDAAPVKRKTKKIEKPENNPESDEEESDSSSPGSSHTHPPVSSHLDPSPLAMLKKKLSSNMTTPTSDTPKPTTPITMSSPLMALANSLYPNPPPTLTQPIQQTTSALGNPSTAGDDDDEYD